MPHIIVVFPTLTRAEPSAVDMEPEQKKHMENSREKNEHNYMFLTQTQKPIYLYSVWLVWILKAPVHQVDSFPSKKR